MEPSGKGRLVQAPSFSFEQDHCREGNLQAEGGGTLLQAGAAPITAEGGRGKTQLPRATALMRATRADGAVDAATSTAEEICLSRTTTSSFVAFSGSSILNSQPAVASNGASPASSGPSPKWVTSFKATRVKIPTDVPHISHSEKRISGEARRREKAGAQCGPSHS